MNCWHCERPAHAGCTFCGRAVCRDHVKSLPHIDALIRSADGAIYALATPEAVHCNVCRPRGKPVRLSEFEAQLDARLDVRLAAEREVAQ